MSDLIQMNSGSVELFSIGKSDIHGGQLFTIYPGPELYSMMEFYHQQIEETKVRDNNNFVKQLYDQYKMALELVKKDSNAVV